MANISRGVAGIAAGSAGLIALAATHASSPSPMDLRSNVSAAPLCMPGEVPLFSCAVGRRHVAVCGQGSTAVYRFGRPGKVELTSRDLTMAMRGFAGGGETQITAVNKGYGYTVFDRTTRTGFDHDGRHDAAATSGLLVRRDGRILSTKGCTADATISSKAEGIIRPGPFTPH